MTANGGDAAQSRLEDSGPRLLVFDSSKDRAALLVQELRARGPRFTSTILDRQSCAIERGTIEVATISLDGLVPNGLVFAAELGASLPEVEFVFWYEHSAPSPGERAARSLGIQRILPRSRLVQWLGDALEPLARMARAKRERAAAESALPPMPSLEADSTTPPMPLHEAERCFRESYVRALFAQTPNTRVAAQLAGLPYTTLCSIAKKMGLGSAVRMQSNPAPRAQPHTPGAGDGTYEISYSKTTNKLLATRASTDEEDGHSVLENR